jgi:predicted O-methyltransferase YrrM
MSKQTWEAVDQYYADLLPAGDSAFAAILKASEDAGLPSIQVSALQGKQLQLMAQLRGAKDILEVGTLGGYSALWLARALPEGGKLVTLELSEKHAQVARENLARAGVGDRIEVIQGPADASLARLAEEGRTFDFVFIDADKEGYPTYFDWAVKLARPGAAIVADNVVRDGKVADPSNTDPRVQGIQRFKEKLAADKRVSATAIQTVGTKGYDGFVLARVLG